MQQPPYDPQGFPYQGNYPPPPQQPLPFYQQPTMQGYPTVPPPTSKKLTVWQRYTTAKRSAKIGIGCGVFFLALCLCMCPIAAIGAANPQKPVAQAPTATTVTPANTHVALVATSQPTQGHPTVVPTIKPTNTPVPTAMPTQAPTQVPTPIPTAVPTQAPIATQAPTQPPAKTGLNGNPWGYDLTAPGNLIYNPPATICDYFNCIASFWKSTNGYVDECVDGTYSHSGGVTGACSRHGREAQPLYSH